MARALATNASTDTLRGNGGVSFHRSVIGIAVSPSRSGHEAARTSTGFTSSAHSTALGVCSVVQRSLIRESSTVVPTAASQALSHDAGSPGHITSTISAPPTRSHAIRPKPCGRPDVQSPRAAPSPMARSGR